MVSFKITKWVIFWNDAYIGDEQTQNCKQKCDWWRSFFHIFFVTNTNSSWPHPLRKITNQPPSKPYLVVKLFCVKFQFNFLISVKNIKLNRLVLAYFRWRLNKTHGAMTKSWLRCSRKQTSFQPHWPTFSDIIHCTTNVLRCLLSTAHSSGFFLQTWDALT